jgi:hypothetical protein
LLDIWSNVKRKHPGLLPLHAHTVECDGDAVLMGVGRLKMYGEFFGGEGWE